MIEFRRAPGLMVWHWHPTCRDWPSGSFEIRRQKPSDGQLCPRCEERDRAGDRIR